MIDAFATIKEHLAEEISREQDPEIQPLNADPWVISSLLQKSIRRGETEMAQTAVLTLLGMRGSAIWQRLILIAFEDLGIGAVDLVVETVAVGMDSAWRKSIGREVAAARYFAGRMAEAPKDRS